MIDQQIDPAAMAAYRTLQERVSALPIASQAMTRRAFPAWLREASKAAPIVAVGERGAEASDALCIVRLDDLERLLKG